MNCEGLSQLSDLVAIDDNLSGAFMIEVTGLLRLREDILIFFRIRKLPLDSFTKPKI